MKVDLSKPLRIKNTKTPVKFVYEGHGEYPFLFVVDPLGEDEHTQWYSAEEIDELLENVPEKKTFYAAVMRDIAEGDVWVSSTRDSESKAEEHGKELQDDEEDFEFLRVISFEVEV